MSVSEVPAPPEVHPLHGGNVSVRPTRFGLAFLLFVGLTLVGCVNYGLSLGYFLTFWLAGLWAVCGVWALRSLPGLEVHAVAGEPVFAGGEAPFGIVCVNPTGLSRDLVRVTADGAAGGGAVLDVPPRGEGRAELRLGAPRRGERALGPLVVESGDPLGLFRARGLVPSPVRVLVYPTPEPSPPPHAGTAPQKAPGGRARVRGDEEFAGLREYRPGDEPRRVSWRHAARGDGNLLVREFDAPGARGLTLDYGALPPSLDVEARLSRLAAWVLVARQHDLPFALRLPGFALPPGAGEGQVRRALTALALFRPAPAGGKEGA